ncbi:MAG: GNAT family acetyltransferase [SAR324 cluster bacterium]|jgi:ribosomal protein S18 acetylase RimI-like enzyme|nr:GNAT family acetyltransferase [SAR324 cluster bacterium]MDP6521895.1 GNAT family acetyltransferase [SAR324 cluster bacterium]|tara:strand:- start:527 stop:961 length:435 start_codon:yes stop_codon:yes gene_type:complete
MTESSLLIRPFKEGDEDALVSLWNMCKLTVPWNNPYKDIARKLKVQAELFLVGYLEDKLIVSVMAGYDGHRGWINYFAVHPDFQAKGYGKQLMDNVENGLRELGCPKINLQIREENDKVFTYYQKLGFVEEKRINMGKRLEDDQ